VHDGDAVVALE